MNTSDNINLAIAIAGGISAVASALSAKATLRSNKLWKEEIKYKEAVDLKVIFNSWYRDFQHLTSRYYFLDVEELSEFIKVEKERAENEPSPEKMKKSINEINKINSMIDRLKDKYDALDRVLDRNNILTFNDVKFVRDLANKNIYALTMLSDYFLKDTYKPLEDDLMAAFNTKDRTYNEHIDKDLQLEGSTKTIFEIAEQFYETINSRLDDLNKNEEKFCLTLKKWLWIDEEKTQN